MNTRQRMEALRGRQTTPAAPVGLAVPPAAIPAWPQRPSFCPPGMEPRGGECVAAVCAPRAHPLADLARNEELADYERTVRGRFEAIVPTLKQIAAIQHESGFEARAQALAQERLGFALPEDVLQDAWVTTLDMRRLYGHAVLATYERLAHAFADRWSRPGEVEAMQRFFIECGFHEVDISPCADGRLKGLLPFVLRLPRGAVHRKAYAGALFDVELNVRHWTDTELRRWREGVPTLPEAGTRYLKIAVYHFSGSDPTHEGCAAHGSDERRAAQAALDRLAAFRTAIENGFCCGASVATLLIGVDTDNDAIRVHVPDAQGEMSVDCYVDNLALYRRTVDLPLSEARQRVAEAVAEAARGAGRSRPEAGMERLIERLITHNLSQIDYVCAHHAGRYRDIGHAERFINLGDSLDEVHLRNLAYFAHLYTIEEGAADLDVGIRIFSQLNVARGLPVPIAIHYRYDGRVPGSRERAVARCRRIGAAVVARYPELARQGLLYIGMTVQDKRTGSSLETVTDSERESQKH
ncbi:carboxysome shell carbonic anhydrase [Thiobacter aerophilum]|uniref:Carboxysome shell carbonic anhydrase n=1 Tax=Thiobacter aerophilum TaxID=3121275 RepID=A0ABV0EJ39_9BURK